MSKISICVDVTMPYASPTRDQIFEAEDNLLGLLDNFKYWVLNIPASFYASYEVVATRIKLRLVEVVSDGHELGIAITEDMTGMPEASQMAKIQQVKTAVEYSRVCGKPLNVVSGCLPHGHDATTLSCLAGMGIPMCIGGNFPANAIPLSDKAAKDAGKTPADWLTDLKTAVQSGEDLVILLDTYVSGNGAWLNAVKQFIPWAKSQPGVVFVRARDTLTA